MTISLKLLVPAGPGSSEQVQYSRDTEDVVFAKFIIIFYSFSTSDLVFFYHRPPISFCNRKLLVSSIIFIIWCQLPFSFTPRIVLLLDFFNFSLSTLNVADISAIPNHFLAEYQWIT